MSGIVQTAPKPRKAGFAQLDARGNRLGVDLRTALAHEKRMIHALALMLQLAHGSTVTLSPLPDRPPGGSAAFALFYQLENLRRAYETVLNPEDTANYTYRGVAEFARETAVGRDAVATSYEFLLGDYERMTAAPDAAAVPEHRWPLGVQLRRDVANVISSYVATVRPIHADFLTVVHKTLWDHRYIHTFFVDIVSRNHRPLRSLGSLATSSRRASLVIKRIEDDVARRTSAIEAVITDLTRLMTHGELESLEANVRRRVNELARMIKSFDERVGNLKRRLYSGVQHANDLVLDRIPARRFAQLEEEVRKLGEGVRASLAMVSVYADIRSSGQTRRVHMESDGIALSPVNADLTALLGLKQATNRRVPPTERERDVYAMYADGLLMQYVMAAGAAMAALSRTAEVRGNAVERAAQEVRYRRARWGTDPSSNTPPGGTEPKRDLTLFGGRVATVPTIERRQFLGPAALTRAEALEDKLWTTFFDAAKLDEHTPATRQCVARLTDGLAVPRAGSTE